jgi:hypothetical protein
MRVQATVIGDQKDPPNAGFTLISPHGTDSAEGFNPELWSYEVGRQPLAVPKQLPGRPCSGPPFPALIVPQHTQPLTTTPAHLSFLLFPWLLSERSTTGTTWRWWDKQ